LLTEKYPDYFGSDTSAKANLEKLSGVNIVSDKIADARKRKDAIIAGKQADYLLGQEKNIADFREKLTSAIVNKIDMLNNTDLKTVQARVKNLKQMSSKGTEAIDGTFEDCVDDFKADLRNTITQKSKVLFDESKGNVNDAEKTSTRSEKRKKSGFFPGIARFFGLGGYESYSYEITTVRAGAVKNTLNNLINDLQDNLINSVETEKKDWKKSVQQKITRALMEAVGDDVDLIDFEMLKTALRRMVGNLELPDFDISSHAFTNSQTGTLEEDEAERFISEVQAYLGELRTYYSKQTSEFLNALEKSAKREKMSEMIFADLKAQLETLEKELGNKKLTLQRLDKCLAALHAAA
jgi:ketosteroid isomerase-like protein